MYFAKYGTLGLFSMEYRLGSDLSLVFLYRLLPSYYPKEKTASLAKLYDLAHRKRQTPATVTDGKPTWETKARYLSLSAGVRE